MAEKKSLPVCPDFVVELRSPTDSLHAQKKMREYRANGEALGLLIDPEQRRVYVYQQGSKKFRFLRTRKPLPAIHAAGVQAGYRKIW